MGLGVAHHVLKRRDHDVLQLLVDDRFLPEVSLAVLHPLEVGGGDAAGVGQNVGHDEHVLVGEDVVGRGGGGTVGAFNEDFRLHLVGVGGGDDAFRGCRNQDFAIGDQQV